MSEVLAKVRYPSSLVSHPNDFAIGAVAPSSYEKYGRETGSSYVLMGIWTNVCVYADVRRDGEIREVHQHVGRSEMNEVVTKSQNEQNADSPRFYFFLALENDAALVGLVSRIPYL